MGGDGIDINQNDSVISGDIISNTVINNDPKAMLEMFFAFQERIGNEKPSNNVDTDESVQLQIESATFQSVLENYKKIGCDKIGLYFDSSRFYCLAVDPSHVIMLNVSSDPENLVISAMKGNTISIDIPIYRSIFSSDSFEKITLSKQKNLLSIARNETLLRWNISNHNSPHIPALEFPIPPLEVKNSDLVKAIYKAQFDPSSDQVFSLHLDVNGNLFVGYREEWQHISKYIVTPEFGKLPIQSQFSWNYLGPIIENNFNLVSHIQFGQDLPLSFFFNDFGCSFGGFLAPRAVERGSDEYSDIIKFEYLEWMERTLKSKGYDTENVRKQYASGVDHDKAKSRGYSAVISSEYLSWLDNTLRTYGFDLTEIRANFDKSPTS